jgi:DNA-binding NtrC family response regulator
MNARILFVDDDAAMCQLMTSLLTQAGDQVTCAGDLGSASESLDNAPFDLVITDLGLGQFSGLRVCERVRSTQPNVPVIVLTAYGTMSSAVDAMRAGAYDFITKPVDPAALALAVARAVQHHRLHIELHALKQRLHQSGNPGELIGKSGAMRRVYALIERVRDAPASVVISGESGTGKELVARALHVGTSRADKPFVAINCAAVPAALLEAELFGHAKGAFTDARVARQGLFQQASGGTLFLDEVGEMPLEMQVKLLRALQERTVRPVGGTTEVPVDVRIVAATNRDLEHEVEQGRFRDDLYYRLNVVQINMPPLRARGNDILLLTDYFVRKFSANSPSERVVRGITDDTARILLGYDWPGNVRQLQNCIERAVTLAQFDELSPNDLPEKVLKRTPVGVVDDEPDLDSVLTLDLLEARYIEKVLTLTAGNKSLAARLLGLDRRTLYRKLDRQGFASADLADGGDDPETSERVPLAVGEA